MATGDIAIGLVIGLVLGLLAGPLLRSWLRWREWAQASHEADRAAREADLMGAVLTRMEADRTRAAAAHVHGPTAIPRATAPPRDDAGPTGDRWQPQPQR